MLARSVFSATLSHDVAMNKIAAGVIACSMIGVAQAAEEPRSTERNPLESKFIIDAGYFFLSTDMRVRVDGETTNDVGSDIDYDDTFGICLLYTSPSPRDGLLSRMPSSA